MPSSTTSFRDVGAVTIVDLSGWLMLGESSAALREAIRELIGKGRNKIILNLCNVTAIDSAGVGELVAAYTTIKTGEGRLKLLNPPQKVHEILSLTQLTKVYEVYKEEASAIRSFD